MYQESNQNYEERNMDAIDRMRTRPLTYMNLILIGVNFIVFVLIEVTGSTLDTNYMLRWGAAYEPFIIQGKEYYRLVTSMFLHFGAEHLLNNMILLFFLGDQLEHIVGRFKYLIIYLVGGIGGNICSVAINLILGESVVSAGASGAVFAVIGAMIWVLIKNRGRLENLTISRLVIMAALSLYVGFSSVGVDNVAHVGGLVTGFLVCLPLYRKVNSTNLEQY